MPQSLIWDAYTDKNFLLKIGNYNIFDKQIEHGINTWNIRNR